MIATTSAMSTLPRGAYKELAHPVKTGTAPLQPRSVGPTAMSDDATRIERDSMGEMRVPRDALWGASTQRAVENFPISGWRFPRRFIRALGLVKHAAATANEALGLLSPAFASAIRAAADEIASGALDAHFVVDVFQTGSGTSTNMNAN